MPQAVKVGLFMSVALALLAYLILEIEDLRLFAPDAQRVDAAFDSVAGLDDKAPVRVAGVRVGRVDGIRLQDDQAVVSLLLEEPIRLTEGTRAAVANVGMLGDKFIELQPGPADAPPLAAGMVIPGDSPVSFDQALKRLDGLASAVGEVVGSIAGEGPEAPLAGLIDNLAQTSLEVRELVSGNRRQVTATIGNFERFSESLADELPRLVEQMRRLVDQVDAVVSENRTAIGSSLENVSAVTGELRQTVDHLNQISGRIARGEGSLGKLVNSEEAHDSLVSTLDTIEKGVDDLSQTLGTIRKLTLDLGFDGYYLEGAEETRTEFNVRIGRPDSGRFYLLGAVDDPRGRARAKTERLTITNSDGSTSTTTTRRLTLEDKITFSAQVGFRLGRAAFRAGLFESSGGSAVDYGFLEDRLWLSMEAFDFGRVEDLDPHLRLSGRWRLHPNISIVAGWDDFLVDERESIFLGAGLSWNDDDLKYLLGSVPTF